MYFNYNILSIIYISVIVTYRHCKLFKENKSKFIKYNSPIYKT